MLARWQVASRPSKKLHGTPGWCFGHCKVGCESGIAQEIGQFRGFKSFLVCYHKNPRQLELSWLPSFPSFEVSIGGTFGSDRRH